MNRIETWNINQRHLFDPSSKDDLKKRSTVPGFQLALESMPTLALQPAGATHAPPRQNQSLPSPLPLSHNPRS